MASLRKNWGDDDDEEEVKPTRFGSGAVKDVVTFSEIKGQKVKTTTKIRLKEVKIKIPKRVNERRNIAKFGDAKAGEENVTLLSKDFVYMEHPDDQLSEDVDDPTLKNTLQSFVMKQQERAINRELDIDGDLIESQSEVTELKPSTGSYVPPNLRGRMSGAGSSMTSTNQADDNTLRVSNLSKNVTDDDLRELFQAFGKVTRIYLPKIEKTENGRTFKEPKGFAFVSYANHDDAEMALDRLQGHGYDHLILKLEWAKPNRDGPGGGGGGGLSGGYVSGYGKQLAQDTKEKVLYASNLTGNRS